MEGMEAATSHAHVCALRMLHEDGGAHRVHACAQNALQDGVGMPRELRDAVSTMHACHMLPGRPLSPGSVCMAHMQEPRASLGKERAPQGQDLPRGKRCQVEVLHELTGACEHGQVCTVHAILLQGARESTRAPAFEE